MSDYLTIEDLKKVYLVTFDARVKWRNILLVLDVSPATINNVGTNCRDNPEDCYREGLSEWLKGGERSWEDVVKALSSPIVGHSDIARTIERDHLQSTGASNPKKMKLQGKYQCMYKLFHKLFNYCIAGNFYGFKYSLFGFRALSRNVHGF